MKITTIFLIAIMSIQLNGCKSKKDTTKSNTTVKEVVDSTTSNQSKGVATANVKPTEDTKTVTISNSTAPKTKGVQQKGLTITYGTSSRGMRESVVVTGKKVQLISFSRSKGNVSSNKTIDDTSMKELQSILERINQKSFSKIKAPSKKHQFDGAPAATVSISNGKETVTCPTFDAGNPPKELEALIAKLLSFK